MVQYLNNNNFNSGFAAFMAAQQNNGAPKKSKFGTFLWWTFLFLVAWWIVGLFMGPQQKNQTVMPAESFVTLDVSAVPQSTIENDVISVKNQGLRISNIDLKNFARSAKDTNAITLIDGDGFIEVGVSPNGTTAPVATTKWQKSGDKMVWRNNDGVEFSRTVTLDNYLIKIIDTIKNNSKNDFSFAPYARILRSADKNSSAGVYTGYVAYVNNDLEHNDWGKMDKKSFAYTTTNGFVGFADQYWETVAHVDSLDQTMRIKKQGDSLYEANTTAAPVNVAAGKSTTITTNIFAGPRDGKVLNDASNTINSIVETMDYGWFWFLAQPMLWCINAIHGFVMNYGLAIIIFTILIRILMWPLTRKSYTSMIAMQKMQPELQRVQKLYANDRQRMQAEMMRVYQTHKTSPMSGCLPMLIQIPIFFALYKALLISVQMRNAHFLWIHDLATMDPYFILPILMGATMWLQQYLQSNKTNSADKNDIAAQTAKTMKWMPILFTIMFAWMPAGLVLYWTVSNIFGIGQMMWLKHRTK